jgi:hypothetical protein
MQIYFGDTPSCEVFDADATFVADGDADNLYYYGVEYGSNTGGFDEIMIYDGLNRQVPIDIASVPGLIKALQMALRASNMRSALYAVEDPETSFGVVSNKE